MTKLSGVIKAGGGYEIELVDHQNLLILPFGQKGTIVIDKDRKSTRLNSSHIQKSRMPSSA